MEIHPLGNTIPPAAGIRAVFRKINRHIVLFVLILSLGIFARTWEWGTVPPGLNQDEASDGVEALSLFKYGTDRTGVSFPMRFVSWGSGQDALYSYMLIPLVAVAGLTPNIERFPMLLAGILSLPLMYLLGRKLRGKTLGLLCMFLLAISPWHIAISRWGLDANLLPLFFLAGFCCLLLSDARNHWFILACGIFGLGLYCYITSYLSIPLFLLLAAPMTYANRRVSRRDLAAGLLLFVVLAIPMALYVIVNTFHLSAVHLGPLTVPRLPSASRIGTDVAVFQTAPLAQLWINVRGFLTMLITQENGAYDQPGYGYLYSVTFPVVLSGGYVFFRQTDDRLQQRLVFAWLVAGILVGVLISPVFVHNNLLFIPLILLCAVCLQWLGQHYKPVFILSVAAFLIGFGLFTRYYHGPDYKRQAEREYFAGLISAFDYPRTSSGNPVCVTTPKIIMPYIFALFSEKVSPSVRADQIVYTDPTSQYRQVSSVGRYFFGPENCPTQGPVSYIEFFNELPPAPAKAFTSRQFGVFKVYVPR